MRRIITIGIAIAMLVTASVALAASLNTYKGSKVSFTPGVGSKKKPVPVGQVEDLRAANTTPGSRAAPLVDIKTTIYGLVQHSGAFPSCDGTQFAVRKTDKFCPKKALVATGPVSSQLGNPVLSTPGTPCNPFLHVWNGGKGKLWFFFITDANHICAGGSVRTGDTAAYPGFMSQHGANLVTDVPLPADVSTKVANVPNFYGSLVHEVLTFPKSTIKSKGGKTVGYYASVGCKKGKRPYSVRFTAVSGSQRETKTVSGSAKC